MPANLLHTGLPDRLFGGSDDDFYRAIANITAGLGAYPTPSHRASTLTRRTGTDAAPCVEARQAGKGTATERRAPGDAGEESHSPATPTDGEIFDLRSIPAELRDDTRDYLCRHDLAWKEPCADCDADMERTDCPDCDGRGQAWQSGPYDCGGRAVCIRTLVPHSDATPATCPRCDGHGWLMRCTGCLAYDDDPRVLAAERRALGLTGEEEPK